MLFSRSLLIIKNLNPLLTNVKHEAIAGCHGRKARSQRPVPLPVLQVQGRLQELLRPVPTSKSLPPKFVTSILYPAIHPASGLVRQGVDSTGAQWLEEAHPSGGAQAGGSWPLPRGIGEGTVAVVPRAKGDL